MMVLNKEDIVIDDLRVENLVGDMNNVVIKEGKGINSRWTAVI
jgi:hypothetical protein